MTTATTASVYETARAMRILSEAGHPAPHLDAAATAFMSCMTGGNYDDRTLVNAYRQAEQGILKMEKAVVLRPANDHDPWCKAFMEAVRPGINERMRRFRDNSPPGTLSMPKLLAIMDKRMRPDDLGMNKQAKDEYLDEQLNQRAGKAMQQARISVNRNRRTEK